MAEILNLERYRKTMQANESRARKRPPAAAEEKPVQVGFRMSPAEVKRFRLWMEAKGFDSYLDVWRWVMETHPVTEEEIRRFTAEIQSSLGVSTKAPRK